MARLYGGGGGGGSVSPLTTKGDLYGYDTADNRIPVGTDGQILSADSVEALGVKWINAVTLLGNAGEVAYFFSATQVNGLPDGTAGQVLSTNGAGVLSWVSNATAPSAPFNSVQFNNAGAFGGDATFTWDNVNKNLLASSGSIVGGFNNAVFGFANSLAGGANNLIGGNVNVTGNSNLVGGEGNNVTGGRNLVGGDQITVVGDKNVVGGDLNSVTASKSAVFGASNTLTGGIDGVLVAGSLNNVAAAHNGVIGYGNSITSGTSNFIGGESNTIAGVWNAEFGQSNAITGNHNLVGGFDNTISNSLNVVGGQLHNVTGNGNGVFGWTHVVSGNVGIVSGESNNLLGLWSGAFGKGHIVSGAVAFAFGDSNEITQNGGFAAGGLNYVTNQFSSAFGQGVKTTRWGEVAYTGKTFGGGGKNAESQTSLITGGTDTANATPKEVELNFGVDQYVSLENDTTNYFEVIVVGRNKDVDNESATYKFEGMVTKAGTAASVTVFGLVKTVIYEDVAAWDANVSADTTNGRIATFVTGVAATNIRWTASYRLVQVKG